MAFTLRHSGSRTGLVATDKLEQAKAAARRIAVSNVERKRFEILNDRGDVISTCDYTPGQRMKWIDGLK